MTRPDGHPSADDPRTPAELARWEKSHNSPANRALYDIAGRLADLTRAVDAWLAEHGAGCRCDFCKLKPGRTAFTVNALRGIRWAAGNAVQEITCDTCEPSPVPDAK